MCADICKETKEPTQEAGEDKLPSSPVKLVRSPCVWLQAREEVITPLQLAKLFGAGKW